MARASLPKINKTCVRCGAPFEVPHGRSDAKFCGTTCRNLAGADAVRKDRRCPCGAQLPGFADHPGKFCSDACRSQYGKPKGRKPDPKNYVTFNCRNCGVEVTRYRKYGNGANLYCSNACAMKHTKRKRHIVLRDEDDVVLDSSYEAMVWGMLRLAKIPVERFDRQHGVAWREGGWYAPDLWLPDHEVAIECKGYEDPDDPARWDAYRSTGVRLVVLDRTTLRTLSCEALEAMVGPSSHFACPGADSCVRALSNPL